MKKLFILMIGIVFLSSCGPRDYESIKNDSKDFIIDFLEALKDNEEFDDGTIWGYYGYTPIKVAKLYNPGWEPSEVVFEEEVDTIVNKKGKLEYVIVHAKYNGQKSKFLVQFNGDNGREGKPALRGYYNFIKFDFEKFKKENGFEISEGIEKSKEFDNVFVMLSSHKFLPTAAKVVKNYLGSIKAGHKGLTYYPSSKNLKLRTDSTIYNTSIASVSIVSFDERMNTTYKFSCKNGVVFWVKGVCYEEKYQITASSGLYPFEEELRILNERNKTNITINRPQTDAGCIKALSEAQNNIQYAIERDKAIKYWTNLGFAITHFKNWFEKPIQLLNGQTGYQQSGKMVEMEFINLTSKTIKYVVLYMRPKNRVGDYYGQPIKYSAVGPISPNHKGSISTGEIFDDELISSFETTIEIIYDDGSKKIIKNEKEWKNVKCEVVWWN